jgi:N-acyl-D-aspartate/D-glutamate deacylase
MPQVIAAIVQARSSGVDVTANQYPYVAGATSLGAVVPPKYHDGGTDAFVARLKDPATRTQIRKICKPQALPSTICGAAPEEQAACWSCRC